MENMSLISLTGASIWGFVVVCGLFLVVLFRGWFFLVVLFFVFVFLREIPRNKTCSVCHYEGVASQPAAPK